MSIGNDNLVLSLVIRFNLSDAQGDHVGVSVRDELVPTTVHDFRDALVELECGWRVALHLHRDVAILIFTKVQ